MLKLLRSLLPMSERLCDGATESTGTRGCAEANSVLEGAVRSSSEGLGYVV
jgi:hypothetical protein